MIPMLAALVLALAPAPQSLPGDPATLKKSCDHGAAEDCYRLAGIHARGEGGPAS
jgi:hypothetical protein